MNRSQTQPTKAARTPLLVTWVALTLIVSSLWPILAAAGGFVVHLKPHESWGPLATVYFAGPSFSLFPFVIDNFIFLVVMTLASSWQLLLGKCLYVSKLMPYAIVRTRLVWLWWMMVLNPLVPDVVAIGVSGLYALILFWLFHPKVIKQIENGFVRKLVYREGLSRGLSDLEPVRENSSAVVLVSILQMMIAVNLLRVSLWTLPMAGKYLYVQTIFEFFIVLCLSKWGAILVAMMLLTAGYLTLKFHHWGRFLMNLVGWVTVLVATVNILLVDYSRFDEIQKLIYLATGLFFVIYSYGVIIVLRNFNVRAQFKGDIPKIFTGKKGGKWFILGVVFVLALVFGLSLKSGERTGIELFKNIFYLVRRHDRDRVLERWQEVQAEFSGKIKNEKFAEAVPVGLEGLRLTESLWGPDHPNVAAHANDLGVAYFALQDFNAAEVLFARALDIHEYILGPNDPVVAADLNNLAMIYKVQDNLDRAGSKLIRALDIYVRNFGPDHFYSRMTQDKLRQIEQARKLPLSERRKILDQQFPSPPRE